MRRSSGVGKRFGGSGESLKCCNRELVHPSQNGLVVCRTESVPFELTTKPATKLQAGRTGDNKQISRDRPNTSK